jgi:hypothetical protein
MSIGVHPIADLDREVTWQDEENAYPLFLAVVCFLALPASSVLAFMGPVLLAERTPVNTLGRLA